MGVKQDSRYYNRVLGAMNEGFGYQEGRTNMLVVGAVDGYLKSQVDRKEDTRTI